VKNGTIPSELSGRGGGQFCRINRGAGAAAYGFTLNLELALNKAGVRDLVDIDFVTPEPYLDHFDHDGIGNARQILDEAFAKKGII